MLLSSCLKCSWLMSCGWFILIIIIIYIYYYFQFSGNALDAATGGSRDTCKRSEPCGWALYTPGSSPRKIYKYTRNILWVPSARLKIRGFTFCLEIIMLLQLFLFWWWRVQPDQGRPPTELLCVLLQAKGDFPIQVIYKSMLLMVALYY